MSASGPTLPLPPPAPDGGYLGISCRQCGQRTTAEDDPERTRRLERQHGLHDWIKSKLTLVIHLGAVAGLVGIEGGVVSGVFNLESLGVRAPSRRPRHDKRYHEARTFAADDRE